MNKIHIIGICGKAMSGLAVMLKNQGWSVTGSDAGFFDPTASYLKKHGVDFYTNHAAENIPKDADAIVIGKHAKLNDENPEVAAAFSSGKTIYSLPSFLSELFNGRDQIMVAGSFGKSTCTGLASWITNESTMNAGYFIGGEVTGMEFSAAYGEPPYFIIEGDEYPSANFDAQSKFLHFHPKHLLLTSCEHDHVNVFPTLESYLVPYKQLIAKMPTDGVIVAFENGAHLKEVLADAPCKVIWYGYSDSCGYKIEDISYGEISTATVKTQSGNTSLETQLLGTHNIENTAGVFALLDTVGIPREKIIEHTKTFQGIKGRLDRISGSGVNPEIFLGFGSSYAKARGCIDALKLHFPSKKLHIIFEPHTFSWRDPNMQHWYKDTFSGANDVCIVMPPEEHGKNASNSLSAIDIKNLVAQSGINIDIAESKEEARKWYQEKISKDDIVLLLTSGNLENIPNEITLW